MRRCMRRAFGCIADVMATIDTHALSFCQLSMTVSLHLKCSSLEKLSTWPHDPNQHLAGLL
jgi:hypothetical protein